MTSVSLMARNVPKLARSKRPLGYALFRSRIKILLRLNAEIDRGEAEVIALALEQKASLVLLDDSDAREKARIYQLEITGIIGILLRAKYCGKIASLAKTLEALQNSGFWMHDRLIHRVLLEADEKL